MTSIPKTFAAVLALGAACASPAYAGDAESCKKVRFADVGWTDIQVTTGATSVVLEALGYRQAPGEEGAQKRWRKAGPRRKAKRQAPADNAFSALANLLPPTIAPPRRRRGGPA